MGAQALDADSKAHLDKAREILTGVLARAPDNADAPFYLGLVQGASGMLDDAIAAFTRAVEANPSHACAHAHIGHVLARMGRASEGLEHLRYAMRLSPRDPNLSYWFGFAGAAELELGHDAKAIDYLNRALALHPTQPRNLLVLVAAHAMAGNRHEARETLARVQQALPHLTNEKLMRNSSARRYRAGRDCAKGCAALRLPRRIAGSRRRCRRAASVRKSGNR